MSRWVIGVPLNLPRRAAIWTFLGDVQKKGSSIDARRLHIANALSGGRKRGCSGQCNIFSRRRLAPLLPSLWSFSAKTHRNNKTTINSGGASSSLLVLQRASRVEKRRSIPRFEKKTKKLMRLTRVETVSTARGCEKCPNDYKERSFYSIGHFEKQLCSDGSF